MKTHFFIIALAIFGMTLLTSCQKEEIDSSELATKENPVFTLKKKGGNNDRNGTRYYFKIDVEGLLQGEEYPARGRRGMQTKYCESIDLAGLDNLTDYSCFDTQLLPIPPDDCDNLTAMVISEDRYGKVYLGYWFKGYGIDGTTGPIEYQVYLRGDDEFPSTWPPDIDSSYTFNFTRWDLVTKSGKNRNLACTGGGEGITSSATVTRVVDQGY